MSRSTVPPDGPTPPLLPELPEVPAELLPLELLVVLLLELLLEVLDVLVDPVDPVVELELDVVVVVVDVELLLEPDDEPSSQLPESGWQRRPLMPLTQRAVVGQSLSSLQGGKQKPPEAFGSSEHNPPGPQSEG
ncbi:MAG: hypothetical protein JST54_05930 [Deltaproteobacteria bacterium]|nr:hypothetical protein [Deltaproteobacteria bacterium]